MKKLTSIDIASNEWDKVESVAEMISYIKVAISKYDLDLEEGIDNHGGIWIRVKSRVSKTIAVFLDNGEHIVIADILEVKGSAIDTINEKIQYLDPFSAVPQTTPLIESSNQKHFQQVTLQDKYGCDAGYYIVVLEPLGVALRTLNISGLLNSLNDDLTITEEIYVGISEHLKSILKVKDYEEDLVEDQSEA